MISRTTSTAHRDTFARDSLPPEDLWPDFDFGLPGPEGTSDRIDYPEQINCGAELLDRMVENGHGDNPCIIFDDETKTYRELLEQTNRIANVLIKDLGLEPGNRVLLRGPNNLWLSACWYAVMKAGGVVVTTMPLLRSGELKYVLEKARVSLCLCDHRFLDDLKTGIERAEGPAATLVSYGGSEQDDLSSLVAVKSAYFDNVETFRDDVALIAFTSGSTGQAKGCVHFHRDVLLICDGYAKHILNPGPGDVFSGTPPFAFTFGLGGLLLFPMRVGASTVLFERATPPVLLEAIQNHRITSLFTAPTMYRELLDLIDDYDVSSLRSCVSAGEHLPPSTFNLWKDATGVEMLDGIGATEMLHIFISAGGGHPIRAGSTGIPVPGYEARIVDDEGNELPRGQVGRLAVRGLTGCRYLDDPVRQQEYVQDGWNLTGDTYLQDDEGYFWYQARSDDMIISSGYNIAGPEVENALLEHAAVHECAVVGLPDEHRGNIVSAFVVLREPAQAGEKLVQELQDHVKAVIAPYKYPRRVEFIEALPRTETGKLQRYRLREIYSGE